MIEKTKHGTSVFAHSMYESALRAEDTSCTNRFVKPSDSSVRVIKSGVSHVVP